MTLRDIAKVIGLHESRISQIKAQAILRLRGCMAKLWPAAQYGRPQTYGRT
jgi:RNA polymerase sigma factor for flagellar operon FliA